MKLNSVEGGEVREIVGGIRAAKCFGVKGARLAHGCFSHHWPAVIRNGSEKKGLDVRAGSY